MALAWLTPGATRAASDDAGVIRLQPRQAVEQTPEPEAVEIGAPRKGFDHQGFEARLESLWFQRKTFVASGRQSDARQQMERIRTFCAEEGIHRLEGLAGALVAEADRDMREGSYDQALSALHFAEALDPGRPQVHKARAVVHWKSDRGAVAAIVDLFHATRTALIAAVRDLSLLHQIAFILGISLVGSVVVFSLLLVFRYQAPFRHEVEEWFGRHGGDYLPRTAGWIALLLPLLSWFAAGWVAIYWIVITFRFMRRRERLTAVAMLLVCALALPAYRVIVTLYGTTADPAVRATMTAVRGEYSPDRIVKLRTLKEAHPDDPVYGFLLAGLYKNGRYFEEAFAEYKQVLATNPLLWPAHINIGNIFYTTGQYSEAVRHYRRALELNPQSFLAYFNMHLAQSEGFRFSPAEESLREARRIDAGQVAELLSGVGGGWGDRPAVQDASLKTASVWDAALGGRRTLHIAGDEAAPATSTWHLQLVNPIAIVSLASLGLCLLTLMLGGAHAPARRCIRCGRPFCHRCKSGREAQEYCSQCVHMYVLGDGLAPGIKSRKLYEVERYEKLTRNTRKIASTLLPGSAQMLRGETGSGALLMLLWFGAVIAVSPSAMGPWLATAGLEPRLDLLGTGEVPALFSADPLGLIGLIALPMVWCLANFWRIRRREA